MIPFVYGAEQSNQVTLFEFDGDQNVDCHRGGEEETASGHHWRCEEGEQEIAVKRMTDQLKDKWLPEGRLNWCVATPMATIAAGEPQLAESEIASALAQILDTATSSATTYVSSSRIG